MKTNDGNHGMKSSYIEMKWFSNVFFFFQKINRKQQNRKHLVEVYEISHLLSTGCCPKPLNKSKSTTVSLFYSTRNG